MVNTCRDIIELDTTNVDSIIPVRGNIRRYHELVLGILAQFNSMERGLIRSRMESGYNHYRSRGGVVGRKKGYRKTDEQMKSQYAEELRLLRKGYSLANVSKLTGTAINTLRKVSKIGGITGSREKRLKMETSI